MIVIRRKYLEEIVDMKKLPLFEFSGQNYRWNTLKKMANIWKEQKKQSTNCRTPLTKVMLAIPAYNLGNQKNIL
jgi:hypothetical protein